ncbi:MAG: OsmC family protein [Rhizobiaceae bacterium]
MTKQHAYGATITWTGNRGTGTSAYRAYDRTWNLESPGKPVMGCSNDPLLGGDPSRYNPEDMLISALSACHMLWYLHLCAVDGIVVHAYSDTPQGIGETAPDGAGRFVSATLRPKIVISAGCDITLANEIHMRIHQYCFIARSVNFPVHVEPQISIAS